MITDPDHLAVFIGARIRARREYLGRSQAELAQALGKKTPAISLIESGRNRISSVDLAVASHFLKAPIEYFYKELPPSPQGAEVANLFGALTEDERRIVLLLVRTLVGNKGA